MKSHDGSLLRKGTKVRISANKVKEFKLPTNMGIVKEDYPNNEQLVGVVLTGDTAATDFHAKSLTVVFP